jgi:hypothetical protein
MLGFALALGVGEVLQLLLRHGFSHVLGGAFELAFGGVARLAVRAAPAAFCWAADLAGMMVSPVDDVHGNATPAFGFKPATSVRATDGPKRPRQGPDLPISRVRTRSLWEGRRLSGTTGGSLALSSS